VERARLTLEWHHLLVTLPGAQQVERIAPALDLLSDLANSLQRNDRAGRTSLARRDE